MKNPTSKTKLLYAGCLIKTAFNHFLIITLTLLDFQEHRTMF